MTETNLSNSFEMTPDGVAKASVLLIHGLTGNPSEMRPLGEYLVEKGFHCLGPCLLGHAATVEELSRIRASEWLIQVENAFNNLKETSQGPYFVVGLSFGAILSLHLATKYPGEVKGVVSMSAPIKFKSKFRSLALRFLSYMPDFFLDILPAIDKRKRKAGIFSGPRHAYPEHSIGAASRLVQIRKKVIASFSRLESPLLVLYDPNDHHVSENSFETIQKLYRGEDLRERSFPGGQHELTLGHSSEEVFKTVEEFLLCHVN